MFKKFILCLFLLMSPAIAAEKPEPIKHLSDEQIYEMMKKFAMAFEVARTDYVEEIDEKKAIEAAINGMLESLDPHSSYLNADDYHDFTDRTSGQFGGLGIQITADRGVIKVISPMDDSPAQRAGINAGDYITHIDNEQVQGLTLTQAVKKMKGKPGTKVKLTIIGKSMAEPKTITLTRAMIKVNSVKFELKDDNVGYIRISDFGATTVRELHNAIKDLNARAKKNKKEIIGYVIDVRNNPGGFLEAAIGVSDTFLESGEIVSTRGRKKTDVDRSYAKSGDMANGKPIVVLINHGSASASEIVAGAIQDNKRGLVMGTQSFGKGSVQQQKVLGDNTAIHLTIARYYTPNGTSIQGKGITPDVEIMQSKVETLEKKTDIFSEATLINALKNEDDKSDKNNEKSDEKKDDKSDYQLERAVDMVRALSVMQPKPTAEKSDDKSGDKKSESKSEKKDSDKKIVPSDQRANESDKSADKK